MTDTMTISNQEKILETVKTTISTFADQEKSIDIENITPEFTPYVIDKILEKSTNVVVIDNSNELLNKYNDKFAAFLNKAANMTVYSSAENMPFYDNSKIIFHRISENTAEELHHNDIRSAIIGDGKRFTLERFKKVPSYKKLKYALANLFTLNKNDYMYDTSTEYSSLTNFNNKEEVQVIMSSVKNLVDEPVFH